jgi:hypothetical protein
MRTAAVLVPLLFAGVAPTAFASDWITNGGTQVRLNADAAGDIGVSWAQGGTRTELVVPVHGQVFHATLPGPDVSRIAPAAGLPSGAVVRRTPSGWLVAVQRWVVAAQPVALHVARWKGTPTALTLSATATRLSGRATFQGKPVTGFSTTPAGTRLRIYVYVDCFGCPAARHGWSAMIGLRPKADGTFAVLLRPSWRGSHYRAAVAGPNIGATLAPDAEALAPAP